MAAFLREAPVLNDCAIVRFCFKDPFSGDVLYVPPFLHRPTSDAGVPLGLISMGRFAPGVTRQIPSSFSGNLAKGPQQRCQGQTLNED